MIGPQKDGGGNAYKDENRKNKRKTRTSENKMRNILPKKNDGSLNKYDDIKYKKHKQKSKKNTIRKILNNKKSPQKIRMKHRMKVAIRKRNQIAGKKSQRKIKEKKTMKKKLPSRQDSSSCRDITCLNNILKVLKISKDNVVFFKQQWNRIYNNSLKTTGRHSFVLLTINYSF